MKKFIEEFKAFALRGNVMDMAIGVIIGGAFSTLVTSLTDNLISPILGILGKVNFDAMMWDVFGDGKLVFKYGAFITAVINFLIMAFVLFCIVKAMNKLMHKKAEEEAKKAAEAKEAETAEETAEDGKERKFFKKKKDKKDEKIEELTDRLTRQMAEFDNFRKRTEKEKANMYAIGAKDIIEKILPVVDSFERGLATVENPEEDPFADGMNKVYKQFTTALDELGVTVIEAVGKEFDPNLHNAVMHVEDEEAGENIVVEEFMKGYMYKGSVVRHSMVKVAN